MSTPYLGEIKLCAFNFAPRGFALCNGQLLPINQNQALFSLFGTTYGGDGRTTFALPDLRGRTPNSFGSNFTLGARAGQENHTLLITEIPQHDHQLNGTSAVGDKRFANGNTLAADSRNDVQFYSPVTNPIPLAPASVGSRGGNQAHNNMQPYLVITFVVALQGIFPSRN
ncbi:MAG: tail fiber protein [Pseudomonadota bacterium]|uniref:phage tail protein n=1 Tax=Sphingomonas sp. ERG5 TaxID=1381597 RepID=UPI00054BB2F5|nr:tail fiber protein [Sphingomonas sp. ERG5]